MPAATSTAVVIATKGRPRVAEGAVRSVLAQTAPATMIALVVTAPADVPAGLPGGVTVVTSAPGLTKQRNAGIDAVPSGVDVVVFLDDDIELAPDYLEQLAAVFDDPTVVGATGNVIADGMVSGPVGREEAQRLLHSSGTQPGTDRVSLYGCNMAARREVAARTRFDEALPLYGWLEDRDFSVRLRREGRLVWAGSARAVHLGFSGGRVSGVRMGYSQVVNPLHLHTKGTLTWRQLGRYWVKAVGGNLTGLVRRDAEVDRVGRMRGNLLGLLAVLRRSADPARLPG